MIDCELGQRPDLKDGYDDLKFHNVKIVRVFVDNCYEVEL